MKQQGKGEKKNEASGKRERVSRDWQSPASNGNRSMVRPIAAFSWLAGDGVVGFLGAALVLKV